MSIAQPYTIAEIRAKIASHDYNAEMMLQHLMIRVEELEEKLESAKSYISILEDCQDGYYRANETAEAVRYNTLNP